jgi:hypothetical protein
MVSASQTKVIQGVNVAVFIIIFFLSSYVLQNSYSTDQAKKSLFGYLHFSTRRNKNSNFIKKFVDISQILHNFYDFFCQNFCIKCRNDIYILAARIVLSSFLKDGIVSVLMPNVYQSKLKPKLTENIQGRTFEPTWIPKSDVVATNHVSPVYSILSTFLPMARFVGGTIHHILDGMRNWLTYVFDICGRLVVGLTSYSFRTTLCSLSVFFLIPLFIGQTLLRLTRRLYNFFELLLTMVGRVVNDLSLLQIDVIKSTNLSHGEAVGHTINRMGDTTTK